jgi:arylsulfatase A-like enzyme
MSPARTGITAPECHVRRVQMKETVHRHGPFQDRQLGCASATRLDPAYYTLAEALKDADYATGHFGKWHLGAEPYDPLHQGFDVDVPHWPGPGPAGSYVAPWRFPDFKPRTPHEHLEDRMGDEAVAFIETHRREPFFLNYWQFSVHAPFDAKKKLIAEYEKRVDPDSPQHCPTYAAMVQSLDENVGKIMDTVDRLGLSDNTIFVFFSDNGGNCYNEVNGAPPTSNLPLRGGKATLYEGGIREPAIVVWPGVVPAGSRSEALIESEDLYPTLIEMAGARPRKDQPCDGVSLVPLLRGGPPPRNAVFTYFPHNPKVPDWLPPAAAVRQGDWKLIRVFFDGENGAHRYELYNLRDDPGERHNLAAAQPAKVRELDARIEAFLARTGAVLPGPNPRYRAEAADVVAGWPTTGNRRLRMHISRQARSLLCRVFHPGGAMTTTRDLDLPAGRYRLELSLLSWADGFAEFAWLSGSGKNQESVPPELRRRIPLKADDVRRNLTLDWNLKRSVRGLRFAPVDRPGTLLVYFIRIRDEKGGILREWRFDHPPQKSKPQPVVGGWRGGANGHAICRLKQGVLVVRCKGNDPMLKTAASLDYPPGRYVWRLRMKANAGGNGLVFTRPANRGYVPGSGTGFTVRHDDRWHEYDVRIEALDPIHEIRFDPCTTPGSIEIDWIRLERPDGKRLREWTFDR